MKGWGPVMLMNYGFWMVRQFGFQNRDQLFPGVGTINDQPGVVVMGNPHPGKLADCNIFVTGNSPSYSFRAKACVAKALAKLFGRFYFFQFKHQCFPYLSIDNLYIIYFISECNTSNIFFMSQTKPTLLRLRQSTVDALKLELKSSAHRSMAALADDILATELDKRFERRGDKLDRLVEAARRVT